MAINRRILQESLDGLLTTADVSINTELKGYELVCSLGTGSEVYVICALSSGLKGQWSLIPSIVHKGTWGHFQEYFEMEWHLRDQVREFVSQSLCLV